MTAQASPEAISKNLEDAGCGSAQIDEFWRLFRAGRERELRALLAKHRRHLLDSCHAEQKKIDCLDYLVYQLEHDLV